MKKYLLTAIAFTWIAALAQSQHKYVPSEGHAAFEGYDLISYFTEEEPLLGKKEFTSTYDGLTLHFANAENKKTFDADPDRYMPAYGGYCATAVSSKNYIVPNFENYSIQNDRLLFFEVRGFWNGRTQWEKDPQLNEILADKYYREKFKEGND